MTTTDIPTQRTPTTPYPPLRIWASEDGRQLLDRGRPHTDTSILQHVTGRAALTGPGRLEITRGTQITRWCGAVLDMDGVTHEVLSIAEQRVGHQHCPGPRARDGYCPGGLRPLEHEALFTGLQLLLDDCPDQALARFRTLLALLGAVPSCGLCDSAPCICASERLAGDR